jgi:hypothetical protein
MEIVDGRSSRGGELRTENAARIVACVNALAGVEDPEAAIREALGALAMLVADCDNLSLIVDHTDRRETERDIERARSALKALEGLRGVSPE